MIHQLRASTRSSSTTRRAFHGSLSRDHAARDHENVRLPRSSPCGRRGTERRNRVRLISLAWPNESEKKCGPGPSSWLMRSGRRSSRVTSAKATAILVGAIGGIAVPSWQTRRTLRHESDRPIVALLSATTHADVLTLETLVVDGAAPAPSCWSRARFHPGGGGQLPDRGRLALGRRANGSRSRGSRWPTARVLAPCSPRRSSPPAAVQAGRWTRPSARLQTELHTNAHVLNAPRLPGLSGARLINRPPS